VKVLFAITNMFYDKDFLELYKSFDKKGYEIKVATNKGFSVYGIEGTKIMPDYKFQDLAPYLPNKFDVLILLSYFNINSFNVTELKELIGAMLNKGKVVAIRTAPLFLAQEKLIKGKRTTWDYINFPQYKDFLEENEIYPIKADYYIDGNYISSRGCCYEDLTRLIELAVKELID
jgi:putative intracellular protease/amidase